MIVLIRLQIRSVLYSMFNKSRMKGGTAKKAAKGTGIAALAVYVIAALAMFFGNMFILAARTLLPLGFYDVYMTIASVITFLFGMFGSMFISQKLVFEAGDNDFLLSLPFKPSQILISRLVALYALSLSYGGIVYVSASVCGFIAAGFDLKRAVAEFVILLLLPALSTTLSVLIGWAMSALTKRLKKKTLVMTALTLVFIAGFMMFYMNISNILSYIAGYPEKAVGIFRSYGYPFFVMGQASCGNITKLLISIVISAVPVAAVYAVLSRSFIGIATSSRDTAVYKFKSHTMKSSSVRTAMTKKELKKILSSPNYLINSGFGCFVLIIFAGIAAVKGNGLFEMFTVTDETLAALIPVMMVFAVTACCGMISPSSAALSLEGRNFDVLKSMPLSFGDVILPKVYANFIFGAVPFLVLFCVALIRLHGSPMFYISLFVSPLLMLASTSLLGIRENIAHPKFDWTNEIVVIKQSSAVLVHMLWVFGMIICGAGVCVGSAILSGNFTEVPYIAAMLFFALTAILNYILLLKSGRKKYEKI